MSIFKADRDSAHVPVPPPALVVTSILIGVGLQHLYAIHLLSRPIRRPLGIALIALGMGTILHCAWRFRKAKTGLKPWTTTTQVLMSGAYRFSRNPMYLSFVIGGLGVALLLNNLWVVLMQIPLIVVITKVVIGREERYLEEKFGEPYREYKRRVRRWI